MEQDFYSGRLRDAHGLTVLVPGAQDRLAVHDIIFDELCLGENRDSPPEQYPRAGSTAPGFSRPLICPGEVQGPKRRRDRRTVLLRSLWASGSLRTSWIRFGAADRGRCVSDLAVLRVSGDVQDALAVGGALTEFGECGGDVPECVCYADDRL
jgi:hypothetical protein